MRRILFRRVGKGARRTHCKQVGENESARRAHAAGRQWWAARKSAPLPTLRVYSSESETSAATQRVAAYCPHTVRIAMVIGTPMKAPGMPQRKLQKNTANSTMNGEIARVVPARRGSM